MHQILGFLAVNFVLCLICFIAYSSQIFIIWPWYGSALSVELISLLLPFNALVFMLLWNYYLCVVTDPGRVPQGWRPDTQSTDGYEVKSTGEPRFCRTCKGYKPPRTHHCRTCNRCVLRMDHHCPWVNNCVGHFNYGHFIRFLFYVDVACSYHLAMVTMRVMDIINHRYWDYLSGFEFAFIVLNYVACIPVFLAVGAFSIYHFLGVLGNTTTIEGWEKDKAATLRRRGIVQELKFPYVCNNLVLLLTQNLQNLGQRRNLESILGTNPLWWCWPSITPGNGLKYELVSGEGTEIWPPPDPSKETEFVLPSSPWTYGAETLNPELQASNSQLRQMETRRRTKRKVISGASALPPYHPDYQEGGDISESYTISSDEDEGYSSFGKPRVRRGSEGYEVRGVENREDMLRRYIEDLSETPGRYHRYISQPVDSDSEDNLPLAPDVS